MSRKTLFADILLPLAVPNLYTYRIPYELNEAAMPGVRALVQFGRNKFYTALIKTIHENPSQKYQAKYLEDILDTQSIVNNTQFAFWDWMSAYYLCHTGEVMNAALPSGLKLSSETKLVINPEIDLEKEKLKNFSDAEYILMEAIEKRNVLSFTEAAEVLTVKNPQGAIKQLLAKKLILLYEEVKEKYKPKIIPYIKLHDKYHTDEKTLQELFANLENKAFKQLEVLLFYLKETKRNALAFGETKRYKNDEPDMQEENAWLKRNHVLKHFDGAVINALVKKNVFIQEEFETGRFENNNVTQLQKDLSPAQSKALQQIEESFKTHQTCLLHGITGSGKTEIYCALIEKVLAEGKQVLYLLPEIALTTQLVSRIKKYFGDKAGVYHSRFSENERVEVWNAVLQTEQATGTSFNKQNHTLILGARSALFLPFTNIGLIIIDEEHDSSYKQQDPAPRYHARDAAIYLASLHKAKVLLGTATPSIESYYNALQNKYGLVELNERFGKSSLPVIKVIDMRREDGKKTDDVISEPLFAEMNAALAKKEQIILFQNRRGFAPYTECFTCGHIPLCVQCDVSLIYHKATNKLTCHYCGYTTNPPKACVACGSTDLRYRGFGTQKVEEELSILFPAAKTKRMDIDSTRSKHAYKQIMEEFDAGDIDILTGTQMLSKGLDFDNVGLVGVLQADHLLSYPDFRAHERAFQLMTQVSGRAGRRNSNGKVFIQTTQPQHPVINWVVSHDYKQMYNTLLAERQEFLYPPFTRLFSFLFICKSTDELTYAADWFAAELRKLFHQRVFGPQYPIVSRIKNEYHKQILLKVERNYSSKQVRQELNKIITAYKTDKLLAKVKLKIDVDCY